MLDILTVYILAYIVVGIGLALIVEDMRPWNRLIFIVWPIPIGLCIFFIIYAILKGCYVELIDYIKRNKR